MARRLATKTIKEVKRLYKEGVKYRDIQKMMGVSPGTIARLCVKRRRSNIIARRQMVLPLPEVKKTDDKAGFKAGQRAALDLMKNKVNDLLELLMAGSDVKWSVDYKIKGDANDKK